VNQIRASLRECVSTIRRIPADAWTTVGTSPTRGTITVEQIVDRFLVSHAEEHTTQAQATLTALHSPSSRP
jgi:hypothetical protein